MKAKTQLNAPGKTSNTCDLDASPLFSTLPDESRAELMKICRMRRYEAGQTVIADEEMPSFVGCISEGILRMQKNMPDGRAHIVGLLVESDMFGRVFDGTSNFAVEAATDVSLCCFDRVGLEALLSRDPILERLFLINVLDELDAAREWIMLLGGRRVTERLAAFLLILCRRWSRLHGVLSEEHGNMLVHVPVSRSDLAHYLGTRVETISRAIRALADDGIIAIKDPYHLEILNLARLSEAAGNDSYGTG